VPVTPIRGAGQPQGVFVMERLLDLAARELGLDRGEIRRRNLVPPGAMPYTKDFVTRGGVPVVLDSGDYPACQQSALDQGGWDGFPARQAEARADGRYLGIGVANYVEGTGRGPYEQVSVRIAMNGRIDVATGACAMGQGIRTTLAQVVAEQLGGDIDRIRMTTGDSAVTPIGFGGFNSRQAVMAGSSAHAAALKVRAKVLQIAALLLEVDAADLDIEGGDVVCKGNSNLHIPLADVAKASVGTAGFVLPGNLPPGLDATENVIINGMTYANGSVVVEVEVDIALAAVKIKRVVFAHDAGRLINPTIVEGQVTGAIAHGIGNALYEWMGFAADGQPLTTNFADYLLVTATEMPPIEILHHESPTPLNPLGVKGVGESGVLPMAAAIASAIDDALAPFNVSVRQSPLRPTDLSAMLAAHEARP
jgi:carbon-monoxide dehydrogenase large subunit